MKQVAEQHNLAKQEKIVIDIKKFTFFFIDLLFYKNRPFNLKNAIYQIKT